MFESYKKFWGNFPFMETTVRRCDFSKGILLQTFICIALSLLPNKTPLIIFAITSCYPFFCFCDARLKDSGHNPYWLLLLLTGIPGLLYVSYLLLLAPTLTLDNGNKYKEIQLILKDFDTKKLISFELIHKMRYNDNEYTFLIETDQELPEVTILKIDEDGESFTSVDESTSEELFKIFKQNTNYEFV